MQTIIALAAEVARASDGAPAIAFIGATPETNPLALTLGEPQQQGSPETAQQGLPLVEPEQRGRQGRGSPPSQHEASPRSPGMERTLSNAHAATWPRSTTAGELNIMHYHLPPCSANLVVPRVPSNPHGIRRAHYWGVRL